MIKFNHWLVKCSWFIFVVENYQLSFFGWVKDFFFIVFSLHIIYCFYRVQPESFTQHNEGELSIHRNIYIYIHSERDIESHLLVEYSLSLCVHYILSGSCRYTKIEYSLMHQCRIQRDRSRHSKTYSHTWTCQQIPI